MVRLFNGGLICTVWCIGSGCKNWFLCVLFEHMCCGLSLVILSFVFEVGFPPFGGKVIVSFLIFICLGLLGVFVTFIYSLVVFKRYWCRLLIICRSIIDVT